MKNETHYKDMIDIIKHHHQYVPQEESTSVFQLSNGNSQEEVSVTELTFHRVLFGDQLATARARGSQLDRVSSNTAMEQLQGVLPVFEDWHAKVLLLQVGPIMRFENY